MEQNRVIPILALVAILFSILAMVLVNTIPRGNFVAGPVITIIAGFILLIQFILTFILCNISNKIMKGTILGIVLVGLAIVAYFTSNYIFRMS